MRLGPIAGSLFLDAGHRVRQRLGPDMVLVDVNLPDGTGVDVVRPLASKWPETEFVMLTIYQDGDILFNALSAGAHGYLIKPVRTEQLLAAIHDVLEGGR